MYRDHVFHRRLLAEHVIIERGEGVYLYDTEGKRYLDACSSGSSTPITIGYGVKEVGEVMARQAEKMHFLNDEFFTTQSVIDLADRLVEMAPESLNKVWFDSSGSEAVEAAIKLARQYHLGKGNSQRYRVISRWQSHHGTSLGAMSVSGEPLPHRGFYPLMTHHPKIVPPYCYRCPYGRTYPECQVICADDLERVILENDPETISAVIAEPISGPCLAGLTPPPEYYPRIREICDKYDVLFIADEVMTGIGRTGTNFAISNWGVVPDIIVFAKGVSGGYSPLSGIIVANEIIDVIIDKFQGRFNHGHSYAHHPLSCAAVVAVLNIIKREGLIAKAKEQGDYLLRRLRELSGHRPTMGDVRGMGLMAGVEFVKDKATKEPFPPSVDFGGRCRELSLDKGVVQHPSRGCINGVAGDCLLITPPYVITRDQIDVIVDSLDACLAELEEELL